MKLGLGGIRLLLREIGNPQQAYPCVHIAGSNGKGSTAAMIAAVFTAAGYKTGLYTSPHLIDFRERIRVDGKPIPRRAVVEFTERLRPLIEAKQSTFFEATTAIAFAYFAQSDIDVAVIETGLGGRLDATNVVRPILSLITNISLEHQEFLGRSLEKIAHEKGGIIKRGIPCVTGVTGKSTLRVLQTIARERRAPLLRAQGTIARLRVYSVEGMSLDARLGSRDFRKLRLSLSGSFQLQNLLLTLHAVEEINRSGRFRLDEGSVRRGLANVQAFTGFQGRLSLIKRRPIIMADVAHNADATVRLTESLRELSYKELFLVFGVLKDKDYTSMVRELAPFARKAILVSPQTDRARPTADLAAEFRKYAVPTEEAGSVAEGVRAALRLGPRSVPRLITGSHFVVGEALQVLGQKKT